MNNFENNFLRLIIDRKDSSQLAFHIGARDYSYADLYTYTVCLYNIVKVVPDTMIGLYATDDIRTYASILALWFCGKAYVPLNPNQPIARHLEVLNSIGTKHIISSTQSYSLPETRMIYTDGIDGTTSTQESIIIPLPNVDDNHLGYVLFTSGSTGKPKGVKITRGNLWAFLDSMNNIGLEITEQDRCLQPFDLTFDFSVSGYLVPLFKGASIYTVPLKATKFTKIAELLDTYHLTVLQMVPSMIRNLLPYIDEVDTRSIRYNILCGEALTGNIIKQWHASNEDMVTYNMYGPTEDTVFCTFYVLDQRNIAFPAAHNDVVSIGKSFKYSSWILIDEHERPIQQYDTIGELCLEGKQLTPGYWENPLENSLKFFEFRGIRYYKTGDLCYLAHDNNLMFVSRKDFQVKINGFRVELEEIEKQYYEISDGKYSVVIPYLNKQGNTELVIIIEGKEYDTSLHQQEMAKVLPAYEIPHKWLFVKQMPLNTNGKVDRKKIVELFNL